MTDRNEQNLMARVLDTAPNTVRNAALGTAAAASLLVAGCSNAPAPYTPTEVNLRGRETIAVEGDEALISAPNRTALAVYLDVENGRNAQFTPFGATTSVEAEPAARGVESTALGYPVNERFGETLDPIRLGTLTYDARSPEGGWEPRSVDLSVAPDTDPGRDLENLADGWTPEFRREFAANAADRMEFCYENELTGLNANEVLQYMERAARQATGDEGTAPEQVISYAPDQLIESEGHVLTMLYGQPSSSSSLKTADADYDPAAICAQAPDGSVIAFGTGYDERTKILDDLANIGATGHGIQESFNEKAYELLNR